jgi:hypothetical protein
VSNAATPAIRAGLRVAARAGLCAGALAGVTAPYATAAPPDYSAYRAVDPKPYETYSRYGGGGAQFTSPRGELCRIVVVARGNFAYVECLGDLHGAAEGNNVVTIDVQGVATSRLSKRTRQEFLGSTDVGPDGVTREPTGPAGFVPLPAGARLTYAFSVWSGTCAVDTASTRCTITSTTGDGVSKSFVSTDADTTID